MGRAVVACRSCHVVERLSAILALLGILSLLALSGVHGEECNTATAIAVYNYTCEINPLNTQEISIWCPWADNKVYLDAFIKSALQIARGTEFKYVITVKSWSGTELNGTKYIEELRQSLKSLSPTPTVFAIGTTWLSHFINSEVLLNLTENVRGWNYLNNQGAYAPLASVEALWSRKNASQAGSGSQWYAVPIATDTNVLAYNKQTFAAANVSVPSDVAWDNLIDIAKGVNGTNGKWGFGLWENNEISTRTMVPFLLNTTGSGIIDDNRKCGLNTLDVQQAIQRFVLMWTNNFAPPPIGCQSVEDLSFDNLTQPVGGVAMMIVPPNQVKNSTGNGVVGTAALSSSFLGGVGLAINKNSLDASKNMAWAFIKTLVEMSMDNIANNTFSPPPIFLKSTGQNVKPWNQTGTLHAASSKGVFTGKDILSPHSDQPYAFDLERRTIFRCLLDDMVNDKQPVQVAVATLCNKVDDVINHYCRLTDPNCPNSIVIAPPGSKGKRKINTALVVVLAAGLTLVALLAMASAAFIVYQRRGRLWRKHPSVRAAAIEQTKAISRRELVVATNNFNEQNLLGRGGFGTVYKGVLPNGKDVAVKLLTEGRHDGEQEFLNEIEIISKIHHRNLVSVEGFCLERGNLMLVYNYMPNGSLEDTIFGGRLSLTWAETFNILLGTANGINYLHTACQHRIIHRDIKPANILLDEHLAARVADFGMAKNTSLEDTHVSTRIMGTLGYLDPNYSFSGQLTEKSDVYSFGVVMLVTLMGRRPFDPETVEPEKSSIKVPLVEWVRFVRDQALERISARFPIGWVEEEARRCLLVVILCIQTFPDARPSMAQVLQMLLGDMTIPLLPAKEYKEDAYIPIYDSGSSKNSNLNSRNGMTSFSNSDFMVGSTIAATGSPFSPLANFSVLTEGR